MKNLSSPISQKPIARRMAMVKMRALAIILNLPKSHECSCALPGSPSGRPSSQRTRRLRFWRKDFEDASFKHDGDVVGQRDAGHESAFLDGIDALAGGTHQGWQGVLGPVVLF